LAYEVIWQEKVLKDLELIDKKDAGRIVERVKTYLVQNPVGLGTPLKGIFKGLFRYRLGNYRVIYATDMAEKKIIVLHVKPRKEAYR
jgi:mRNA interferase RelE/StbE